MSIKWPLWTHCRLISICHLSLLHTHTHTHTLLQLRCTRSRSEGPVVRYVLRVNGPCPPLLSPSLPPAITWPLTHTHTHTHICLSPSDSDWKSFIRALKSSSVSKPWMCELHRQLPFISETHPQVIDLKRSTADSDV